MNAPRPTRCEAAPNTFRKWKTAVYAVLEAKSSLQPARVGFGTGQAKVNMNRRAPNGEGGWMLGHNPDGVSDKTVAVLRFEISRANPSPFSATTRCTAQ